MIPEDQEEQRGVDVPTTTSGASTEAEPSERQRGGIVPSAAMQPLRAPVSPLNLNEMEFHFNANRYMLRIIGYENSDGPNSCHRGTGFLIVSGGRGYLVTCEHIFKNGKTNFVVQSSGPISSEAMTRQPAATLTFGVTDPTFGELVRDVTRDLAYIPVLQPDTLADAGYQFFQPFPEHEDAHITRIARGFPGEWSEVVPLSRTSWTERSASMQLWDDRSRTPTKLDRAKEESPRVSLGFSIHDKAVSRHSLYGILRPVATNMEGMSGGPVCGVFQDGTVRPIAVLTVVGHDYPREAWAVPVNELLEILPPADLEKSRAAES